MKLYSNAYNYAIYTLNYYEHKLFVNIFAHFRHKEKKYIITAPIPKLLLKRPSYFSLLYTRMSGKSINFNDKKIEKSVFSKNKKPFQLVDIDVNKLLVSKKEAYGKNNALKYFIGYNDNDLIRPLCLRISQMSVFIKQFKENKKTTITMYLMVKDKQL